MTLAKPPSPPGSDIGTLLGGPSRPAALSPPFEALVRLTDAVSRADALEPIFEEALTCLLATLGAQRASILLFDDRDVMRFVAWRGLSDTYRAAVEGHSPWTRDAADPAPILVPDVLTEPSLAAYLPVFEREGLRALGFIPLRYGDRLLGKFMLYYEQPHGFPPEDVDVARIIANHVAFAVESRRAEAALRSAHEELRTIFRGSAEGISAVGPDGRYLYVNDAAARLCGFDSADAMLSTSFSDLAAGFSQMSEDGHLLAPDQLPPMRAFTERRPVERVLVWTPRDASGAHPRVSQVRSVPVFSTEQGAGRDVRFVVTFFRDVTDEHRVRIDAERAARRAERLIAVTAGIVEALSPQQVIDAVLDHGVPALEASAGAVALLDAAGTALEVAGHRGYTDAEVAPYRRMALDAGTPTAVAVTERRPLWVRDAAEIAAVLPAVALSTSEAGIRALAVAPLLAHGRCIGAISFGFKEPHPGGDEHRAILLSIASHCAQALERARLYVIEREARARAEAARRRLEILAATSKVFASAGPGLAELLDDVARSLAEVLGDACIVRLLADDGQTLEPVAVHHRDPEKLDEARAMAALLPRRLEGDAHRQIFEARRTYFQPSLDLESLPPDLSPSLRAYLEGAGLHTGVLVPLVIKGSVVGTLGCGRVAGGAPYTAEDVDLLEDLAERAALAIENARLLEAAQRAVSVRDEFLSIAGHELKTPLTVVRLQVGALGLMVKKGRLDGPAALKVERIARNVDRLSGLVGELLDVSRVHAGKLELHLEPLDFAELVRDNVVRFGDEAEAAGCQIRVTGDAVAHGQWDRLRIEQVIVNLLSNALKYGKGHPVEIGVVAPEGAPIELTVRDHGIGVAAADQARIFERFERAVPSQNFGGLGLGLWITRQVIEAHGGTISVASEVGAGACFRVVLPRGAAE